MSVLHGALTALVFGATVIGLGLFTRGVVWAFDFGWSLLGFGRACS